MTKVNKVKNLTLAELQKQAKELEVQKEVTILINDQPYKFKVDETFKTTKKHRLLNDMVKLFNEVNNQQELLSVAPSYASILAIKHFTSIDVDDTVEGALAMLETLVDLGILADILNEMPEKELVDTLDLLTRTVTNMGNKIEDFQAEAEDLINKVENEEVKELLTNGDTE